MENDLRALTMILQHERRRRGNEGGETRRNRSTCIFDFREKKKYDTIRDKRYEKNPVERSSALKLIPETAKNKKEKGKKGGGGGEKKEEEGKKCIATFKSGDISRQRPSPAIGEIPGALEKQFQL